jgi:hypothetical protein
MPALTCKYFPLADSPTPDDLSALGLPDRTGVRAMATGEKRIPRKGGMVSFGGDQTSIPSCERFVLRFLHRTISCDVSLGPRLGVYHRVLSGDSFALAIARHDFRWPLSSLRKRFFPLNQTIDGSSQTPTSGRSPF